MTTDFMVKMREIGRLTFIHRLGSPKREWNIAIPITKCSSAMIWLHCVKFW